MPHMNKTPARLVFGTVFWFVAWGAALADKPGWQFIVGATTSLMGIFLFVAVLADYD